MEATSSYLLQAKPPSEEFWAINSAIEFDCLEGKRSYLLTGKNGSQVKLSSSAYLLLKCVYAGKSFAELAEILNTGNERRITEEELRNKYECLSAKLREIETQAGHQTRPWGFWMQLPLVPAKYVARITPITSHLFHPAIVCSTMLTTIAGIVALVHHGFQFTIRPGSLLAGFGLMVILGLAHEFGHASACARYKAPPSEIGFTLYLVYPAFYSDVSSAWRLRRLERVVVDVGGCYFQAMMTLAFLALFYRTGWEPFRVAIIGSFYAALSSLNPIFKFDGYWVVADMLGVVNLSRQPQRVYKHLLTRLRGRPAEPLPWPTSVTAILIGYSTVAVLVWGFFVLKLFPMLQEQLILASHVAASVLDHLRTGKAPVGQDVTTLLYSCVLLSLVAITLWSIGKALCRVALKGSTKIIGHLRRTHRDTMSAKLGPPF